MPGDDASTKDTHGDEFDHPHDLTTHNQTFCVFVKAGTLAVAFSLLESCSFWVTHGVCDIHVAVFK